MKKNFLILLTASLVFAACNVESIEENSNIQENLVLQEINCGNARDIVIVYNATATPSEIAQIRDQYFKSWNPCWNAEMGPFHLDPLRDIWTVEFCPCYPDGDNDDLDTTIDNDPRIVIDTGN